MEDFWRCLMRTSFCTFSSAEALQLQFSNPFVSFFCWKSNFIFAQVVSVKCVKSHVFIKASFPLFYILRMVFWFLLEDQGDLLDAGAELLKARSTWALPMHDDDVHAFGLFGLKKNGKVTESKKKTRKKEEERFGCHKDKKNYMLA